MNSRKLILASATAIMAILIASAAEATSAQPSSLEISRFRSAGPFAVCLPHMVDSTNSSYAKYDPSELLNSKVDLTKLQGAAFTETPDTTNDALHLLGFSVQNNLYTKATLSVKGLRHKAIFLDGKPCREGEVKLEPGTHEFAIKYLCLKGESNSDTLKVSLTPTKEGRLSIREDGKHIYSLDINSYGVACGGLKLSASGKYLAVGRKVTDERGKNTTTWEIQKTSDGKVIARSNEPIQWMPKSDLYTRTRATATGRELIAVDPATLEEKVLCADLPEGWYDMSPTEDILVYSRMTPGPKEGEVHEILNPEDRQPGWRDRYWLEKYDLTTGTAQPLTYGWHSARLADIRRDGRKLLFITSDLRLTKRPTTLYSVFEMDLETLETECLIEKDGFIREVLYSPDGKSLLVTGPAEMLGGVCMNLPERRIPNGYDIQMARFDIATRTASALTRDFAPSIDQAFWNPADQMVYALVEDKDCVLPYRCDPKTAKWEKVPCNEDYVSMLGIAGQKLVYKGQSLSSSDRAYMYDTKSRKLRMVCDFSAERLENCQMGEGGAYEFTSSRGDLINGFYVLPPDFDPEKKYPLLVHYYGGCSPSARYCIGAYSPQVYATQGYVFYVINPSGAAGFGQEFASRHVNTAGDVVADDIIEGTVAFCKDHPYVDSTKIGCFSASYGGFMTQLLLAKTDMYTTGISHAGISDHTSYWGEGYWGYSYSEVSMADSYPWTRKDLYVDRSPLYMADRIHTPLLFLHGSADTNVPIGESIQMFTALKLLGQDTAFVVVDGENHGVYDYEKRREWLRTIFAWFAKYLQDDPTWWDELYPQKQL